MKAYKLKKRYIYIAFSELIAVNAYLNTMATLIQSFIFCGTGPKETLHRQYLSSI